MHRYRIACHGLAACRLCDAGDINRDDHDRCVPENDTSVAYHLHTFDAGNRCQRWGDSRRQARRPIGTTLSDGRTMRSGLSVASIHPMMES